MRKIMVLTGKLTDIFVDPHFDAIFAALIWGLLKKSVHYAPFCGHVRQDISLARVLLSIEAWLHPYCNRICYLIK